MRCKNHPNDQSSTVGVCATCLRQRLSAVVAAQAQARLGSNSSRFNATWHLQDVGPSPTSEADSKVNHDGGRFSSLLSGLFRSRTGPGSGQHVVSYGSCSGSSPSWFSGCREMSSARSPGDFPRAKGSPSTGGLRRRTTGRGLSLSGAGVCLSPLFRARPTRNCRENGVLVAKSTTSLCKSRSRKSVDLGRENNR